MFQPGDHRSNTIRRNGNNKHRNQPSWIRWPPGQSFAVCDPQREREWTLLGDAGGIGPKGKLSPAEQRLAELLTLLIEDFEEKAYALKPAKPVEILNELIEANGLKQKDLVDVFGTPSIVSEVLNEKRGLTIEHIKRLSRRFHISPEVFF
jgi:HTH-type transcriptional regulator/antitoxin HigA